MPYAPNWEQQKRERERERERERAREREREREREISNFMYHYVLYEVGVYVGKF
jgi:hypothetical protein